MRRKLWKKWFSSGLTTNDSPSLFEVLCGLTKRCFWALLIGAMVSSLVWCVACVDWNPPTKALIADGFQGAVKSLVSDRQPSVVLEFPSRQADYWLQQIEKVDASNNLSAEELMGAALVLDFPSQEYLSTQYAKEVRQRSKTEDVFAFLQRNNQEYKKRCTASCLDFAKRATQADPSNAELHRLKAMLLFSPGTDSLESPIRSDGWLQTLHASSRHDPDNGLYDYLIAIEYWRSSIELLWDGERETVIVTDKSKNEIAWTHFYRAQQCRALILPNQESRLALEFAMSAGVSKFDAARIGSERQIETRSLRLMRYLGKVLHATSDERLLDGDVDGAIRRCGDMLRLADQWQVERWKQVTLRQRWIRNLARYKLLEVSATAPEQTAKYSPIQSRRELTLNSHLKSRRWGEIGKVVQSKFVQLDSNSRATADTVVKSIVLLCNGVIALALAAVCYLFSSIPQAGTRNRIRDWQQVLCFTVAMAMSVLVLGVVPAKDLSLDTVRILLVAIALMVYLFAVVWAARRWFFTPDVDPPVNGILMVPAVFVFGAAWTAIAVVTSEYFVGPDSVIDRVRPPIPFPIPASLVGQTIPSWAKLLVEWSWNNGPLIGFLFGVVLSMLWCSRLVLLKTRSSQTLKASMWRSLVFNCVQPLLVVGCLFSTLAMYGIPETIRKEAAWHEYRMLYCNTELLQTAYDKAAATVDADVRVMRQLKAEAEAHADSVVEREAW